MSRPELNRGAVDFLINGGEYCNRPPQVTEREQSEEERVRVSQKESEREKAREREIERDKERERE